MPCTARSNRSKYEIIYAMLTIMPCKKTRIMYGANLSSTGRQFNQLEKAELAFYDEEDRVWVRTAKGNRFIEVMEELLSLTKEITGLKKEFEEKRRQLHRYDLFDVTVEKFEGAYAWGVEEPNVEGLRDRAEIRGRQRERSYRRKTEGGRGTPEEEIGREGGSEKVEAVASNVSP
jgi:predicted transcriptional regulator